jgi:hypothetical protein
MALGQQGLVSTTEVRAFQLAALDEIRALARIAEAYPLSEDEREKVRAAINKIEGYTLSLAPAAQEGRCAPWWAWLLAGLAGAGVGLGVRAALSD